MHAHIPAQLPPINLPTPPKPEELRRRRALRQLRDPEAPDDEAVNEGEVLYAAEAAREDASRRQPAARTDAQRSGPRAAWAASRTLADETLGAVLAAQEQATRDQAEAGALALDVKA